jgi:ubiquitin-activating enzyme E1
MDTDLYSRQLFTIGKDAMYSILKSNVLISGLDGLGTEVIKNISLMGVKNITLHDSYKITQNDLETGYYYNEHDIGKLRATILKDKISELNSNVTINILTEELTEKTIKNYDLIVLCNYSYNDACRYNYVCRQNKIKFILGKVSSVYGMLFNDFGESFKITDQNGEIYEHINIDTFNKDGLVTTLIPHNLETDNTIKILSVDCVNNNFMINNNWKVHVKSNKEFYLKEFPELDVELRSGTFVQLNEHRNINYKSLIDNLQTPNFVENMSNPDEPSKLHELWTRYENDTTMKCADDDDFNFVTTYGNQLQPVNSIIGALISSEIIKALTGKYTPLYQLYYWSDTSIIGNIQQNVYNTVRGQGQNNILGNEITDKLNNMNIFVVGAGAIGCELLKNFAMMNIGTKGKIIVTDMDIIEKSNLSRQFLFRNKDIKRHKSEVACEAAKKFNTSINIEYHLNKVCKENEEIYNDNFYNSLNCVANALDNVQARLYMDNKCVQYGLPLLESGTLGTKGNTQIIVPHLTESYGSSQDPPEKNFPVCTIKTFPSQIEHTIQWAREEFDELFNRIPINIMRYVNDDNLLSKINDSEKYQLGSDLDYIMKWKPLDVNDCIKWALYIFEQNYNDNIKVLIDKFPVDYVNSDGSLYWSAGKKYPNVISFDTKDDTHMEYLIVLTTMWTNIWNINMINLNECKDNINHIKLSLTIKSIELPTTEEEANTLTKYDIEPIKHELIKDIKLYPQDFEKDDDTNGHIKSITVMSNMRASNYSIPIISFDKTKMIAGKIIPALATTTSLIAGLISFELYKIVKSVKPNKYRNYFVNLALPLITYSEPMEPPKLTIGDKKYTMWDKFTYNKKGTLHDFITYWEKYFEKTITIILHNETMIYCDFMADESELCQSLTDIIKDKTNITEGSIQIMISNMEEDEFPLVSVFL